MFAYYLQLGLRSLCRNPVLTGLMIIAIGFGVAASMATYAVFQAVSGNPIPGKSSQLFTPQIDNWGPNQGRSDGSLPDALTYTDVKALMSANVATRQAATYPVSLSLIPSDPRANAMVANGYATYADFFGMFNVPFLYGSAWPSSDDARHGNGVVISRKLNQRLFGGTDSVGKVLNLDGNDYRVAGVIDHWNPRPRFFDAANGSGFAGEPDFYMPFTRAIDLQIETSGNNNCSGGPVASGWSGWLQSECVWLAYWVELPDAAAVQRYRSFLTGYAANQQRAGRFGWAPRVALSDVQQWLDIQRVVPPETRVSLLVSLGFLVVCLVNTIGLLLAKFMRRAPEIGVRRALGASRSEIYRQFLLEAAAVGLAGGALGLLLTWFGVLGVGLVFERDIARLAHLSPALVALTILVAVIATVVAALYPTWRAACVQPAWQLKSN
ncbi:MAG TPA: ABC transporter permease [Rhodanobacter sp.]